MPEIDRTSVREWLYLPDIHAFDEHSGETADPTTLRILFALAAAGAKPEDADYKPGEWVEGAASPTGRVLLGAAGVLVTPAPGVWDVYCEVQGTAEQPRHKVGQLVVT
jgi:hypothetical protein